MSVALAHTLEAIDPVVSETVTPAERTRQLMKKLVAHCDAYKGASVSRSLTELAISASGYAVLSTLVVLSFLHGYYLLMPPLMLVAAGFLVRLFIIQHDCGHGSYFNSRKSNNTLGRLISVLTFTPYDFWRRSHNLHHAHSGNIDRRGLGGVDTLTVAEYKALPAKTKLLYRAFRNPALLLLVIAPLNIMLFQRFPPNRSVPWLANYDSMPLEETMPSIMGLNAALLVTYTALGLVIGWPALFFAYLPIVYLTAILGGWLFYIQHQFEHTFWKHTDEWSFHEAALFSSSYYVLPKVLQWFSGNIGIHHIHHFNAKIPNYRLQSCVDASPELQQMNRLTLRESLKCLRWALWDEDQQKLVSFSDLKTA